ncbi:MAG: hypothetical protein LBC61_06635 [Candidatus Peribacteria bacterium]|jgi:hypothetical protein|nr:hypothetical protein [Candidatus Peribacteria bacterium]
MMQKILNGNNCTSKPSNLTQSNRNVRKKIQKVQRSVGNTLASNQIEKLVDLKYGEFSVYKLIFTD